MGVVIRQSFKATIVSYAGACIGAFTVIFLYPKCLTPEQIGLTRTLTEAALLFSFFAQMGMSNVAIKFFPYFKDSDNHHNGFPFIITVFPLIGFSLFVIMFFLFENGIKSIFHDKSNLFNEYIIFVIPFTFFLVYSTIYETYASLLQRIVVPKLIKEVLIRILTISIIILFFFKAINLNQFVFAFVSIYGIASILNIFYINSIQKINLKPKLDFIKNPLKRDMFTFTLFMVIAGVGSSISGRIDVFMIGNKISLTGTGIFTIAFFIASFIEMPSRAIFQITTPFASEALKNNDMVLIGSLYKRVAINQLIISGLLFLLIWANADNIFRIMPNGHLYQSSKYVILFIGLAKVFDAATGINATILSYSKYYYYTLFFIFVLAIITVTSNLILIPLYGIVGSAIATAISIFLYNATLVFFVNLKLMVQPFSINTLKVGFIILLILVCNSLVHSNGNPYLDAIMRSSLIIILFLLAIYKFKVSDDINSFIVDFKNEHLKSLNVFRKKE